MRTTVFTISIITLLFSFVSSCKKDSYHEEIKFVNNSSEDVILTQYSAGKANDGSITSDCFITKRGEIRANSSIDLFIGGPNSIEEMLSSYFIPPYYIISLDKYVKERFHCDSLELKIEYLKKFEPDLEDLKASNFTYYYP